MADSTTRRLTQYHTSRFHPHLHKPAAEYKAETFYARDLGVVTAGHRAYGVSAKWEGVTVIPLDNGDKVQFAWLTPLDFDWKHPVYVQLCYIPDDNASATALTVTYDRLSMGATLIGSGVAADGASTFTETIESVTDAQTDADKPLCSPWGKINGSATEFDVLFLNIVAGAVSAADNLCLVALRIAYRPLTA